MSSDFICFSPSNRDPSLRSPKFYGARQDDRVVVSGASTGVSSRHATHGYVVRLSRRMPGPVPTHNKRLSFRMKANGVSCNEESRCSGHKPDQRPQILCIRVVMTYILLPFLTASAVVFLIIHLHTYHHSAIIYFLEDGYCLQI